MPPPLDENHQSRLYDAVKQFRQVMESEVLTELPQFNEFPKGSCSDTCLLLGHWLEETGFGKWTCVSGWRDRWSHAWLEQHQVLIDITADQFEDGPRAYVMSTNSCWHKQFNGAPSPPYEDVLNEVYVRIVAEIEAAAKQ